jgi:hypothetical protein
MIDERFIYVGVILNFIGGVGYLIDTLKGKTKPNKVTWFFWALAPLIAFAAQIQQGVGLSAWMTFSVGFSPLLIFIASFINKQSEWKLTKFDLICGALALCGLILWSLTRVGNLAIIFSILADLLAATPTFLKAWKAPETESSLIYLLSGINGLIALLTLTAWTFEYYGFPLYILLFNIVFYPLIQFKLGKHFKLAFAKLYKN